MRGKNFFSGFLKKYTIQGIDLVLCWCSSKIFVQSNVLNSTIRVWTFGIHLQMPIAIESQKGKVTGSINRTNYVVHANCRHSIRPSLNEK